MAELHQPHGARPPHIPRCTTRRATSTSRAIFGFGAGTARRRRPHPLLVFVLFRYFDAREASRRARRSIRSPSAQEDRVPPEPRLQTNPRQDLADLRARGRRACSTTYGWVDRNAGVVRIPIEAAMKLTLERGLPARADRAKP